MTCWSFLPDEREYGNCIGYGAGTQGDPVIDHLQLTDYFSSHDQHDLEDMEVKVYISPDGMNAVCVGSASWHHAGYQVLLKPVSHSTGGPGKPPSFSHPSVDRHACPGQD